MKTIKLPPILPGDVDLAAVNQQLRDRTAQLDWSSVVSAPDQHLATLLSGLDPSNDVDVLGDATLSEAIAAKVVQILQELPEQPKPSQPKLSAPKVTPAVWQSDVSLESPDDHPHPLAPSPIQGEGGQEQTKDLGSDSFVVGEGNPNRGKYSKSAPLLPAWEKGLGDEGAVLKPPSHYQIRAELEQAVLADLLGPAGGEYEEVDEARVSDRYLVGLLAPLYRRNHPDLPDDQLIQNDELAAAKTGTVEESAEQLDDLSISGTGTVDDGTTESTNPPAIETMFPSSLGMSFCVSGTAKAIRIQAGWGQYERTKSEYLETPSGAPKTVWRRYPITGQSPPIPLENGGIDPWQIDPDREVYVRGQMRSCGDDWIISLFLVNEQREPDRSPDQAWLFQPELSVESPDSNQSDIFIRKAQQRSLGKLDPVQYAEEQAMEMLYRHQVEFAVGHGTGVHAELAPGSTDRAVRLCTRVVPTYEVPKTDAPTPEEIPGLTGLVLDMKELAESTSADLIDQLNPLVAAYTDWIANQAARIADPLNQLQGYEAIAHDALANCTRALERIQAGLNLLQANPQSLEAFQFMNRAMWQQRVHSIYSEQQRRGEAVELDTLDIPKNRSWRPFQLAFILLNLPSITNLHHPDRSHETEAIADLLWFPTGGGKTEAYLGLTAYTIGLRRLQGVVAGRSGESGVAVLMRYTLRLLTLQQFQRATALICACEAIRRENPDKWGKEPFRIGLWVGQKTTPNRTDQSDEFLKQKLGQYQPTSSGW